MNNPWTELMNLKSSQKEYFLKIDEELIKHFNEKHPLENCFHIYTNRIPVPFVGDINAPIVLLNLNPGYVPSDETTHKTRNYTERAWKNLYQEKLDYPFYVLDPVLNETGGYRYWYDKLENLLVLTSRKNVARKLMCLEYFPYHSVKFGFNGQLKSQEYNFQLVEKSMREGKLIVVMRSKRLWYKAVPSLEQYPNKFCIRSPQNPKLTVNNCLTENYEKIINLLDIA